MTDPDLRPYLTDLEEQSPERLLRIAAEVPVDYTTTALVFELEGQGRCPTLLLENVAK